MATDARAGAGRGAAGAAAALGQPVALYHDPDSDPGRFRWAGLTVHETSPNSASAAVTALRRNTIEALIIDSYAIGEDAIGEAVASGAVAVFRDGAPYGSETLTVDPNPGSVDAKSVLAGPSYIPLAAEFMCRDSQSRERKAPDQPLSVLVAFGMRDSANRTLTALEAMDGLSDRLSVSVALGSGAPNAASVTAILKKMPFAQLLDDGATLADRYGDIDLGIGAPGVSQFERACCSLASLLVPQNERQTQLADAWQRTGAAICCTPDAAAVGQTLAKLLDSPNKIENIRQRGRSLVDGQVRCASPAR